MSLDELADTPLDALLIEATRRAIMAKAGPCATFGSLISILAEVGDVLAKDWSEFQTLVISSAEQMLALDEVDHGHRHDAEYVNGVARVLIDVAELLRSIDPQVREIFDRLDLLDPDPDSVQADEVVPEEVTS